MHLTELAHQYLEAHLHIGDLAIDATAGNGHDTLKMAELVGNTGKVFGIDIQTAAIEATLTRLTDANQSKQCQLIEGDHADALAALCEHHKSNITAMTFNLGYLPGSDKSVQTKPEATLRALNFAQQLLHPKGVLLVTAYRGHEGGLEESKHVEAWMLARKAEGAKIETHEPTANRIPPILWVYRT
ncbi:MAG: tRNA (mnm(5)s(2)U34)-methyltransferase [Opitutaceae bacterium]